MMDLDNLSPRELLHFALYATQNDRSDHAIIYLKQLLQLQPQDAQAMFLLGAEYAQLNMHDEALAWMAEAVEAGPDNHLARFQLGLMHFSLDNHTAARQNLSLLPPTDEGDPLLHYARALLAYMDNDMTLFHSTMESGLSLDNQIESLEQTMRHLYDQLAKEENAPSPAPATNLFLSVYDT